MQTPGHHPGHTEPKPTFSDGLIQWTYTWPSSDNIILQGTNSTVFFFFSRLRKIRLFQQIEPIIYFIP